MERISLSGFRNYSKRLPSIILPVPPILLHFLPFRNYIRNAFRKFLFPFHSIILKDGWKFSMEHCGKLRRVTANSAINLGDTGLKLWNSKTVGETAFDVRADRTTTLVPRTDYTPDNCQRHTADENRRRRRTRP